MSELKPVEPNIWTGRVDHDGEPRLTQRWHQKIKPYSEHSGSRGLALLGLACDEGVRRNHGRMGAAKGPDLIRKCLANLPWNREDTLFDLGNVTCEDGDLESAQSKFSQTLVKTLQDGMLPVGLGGGHEIAWGSFKGLADYLIQDHKTPKGLNIGIINFDAHFDLRKPEKGASSGTPFWQVAQFCEHQNLDFHYMCLGISRSSNTQALFDRADELNAAYITDDQVHRDNLDFLIEELTCFTSMVDHVYLTIDLDVFPSYQAPGVSAPAVKGIPLEIAATLLQTIKESAKVRVMDIAEYNPEYDHDLRTARLAAWLVHQLTDQSEP
ncbi:formimidoylglutamase [Endozoicomonas arenosclerae]|uniref:formimidoylglutamase n=1 Tax=Endozoicomonas arenosclerae TaxID=1633495 RepID=UPI0007853604|nr:formimidoylglutamase [Endozoicomonas arenosclerae]